MRPAPTLDGPTKPPVISQSGRGRAGVQTCRVLSVECECERARAWGGRNFVHSVCLGFPRKYGPIRPKRGLAGKVRRTSPDHRRRAVAGYFFGPWGWWPEEITAYGLRGL